MFLDFNISRPCSYRELILEQWRRDWGLKVMVLRFPVLINHYCTKAKSNCKKWPKFNSTFHKIYYNDWKSLNSAFI